jgi:hypothetical protein
MGNVGYHAVQNLSSRLSFKTSWLKYTTLLIPCVSLCGCEAWSPTLREDQMRVFDKRILRVFGWWWSSSSLARQPYVCPGLPQKLLPSEVSGCCFFRFRDKSLFQDGVVSPTPRIFGYETDKMMGDCRKLLNRSYSLHSSPNIIRIIISLAIVLTPISLSTVLGAQKYILPIKLSTIRFEHWTFKSKCQSGQITKK